MEELPSSEKEKMLPIVLLAPWLNSIKFQNTFDRIEKAIGKSKLIVDLDRYYQSESERESREVFKDLLNATNAHELWINLIRNQENYIPTIQLIGPASKYIEYQIAAFQELQRGYVFRFELHRQYDYSSLLAIIDTHCDEDILVVFDAGWSDYSNIQLSQMSGFIERLSELSNQVRFVIVSSNFPNSFSEYDNLGSLNIGSRQLYEALSKRFDNYPMFYGDWGSTKPRRYDGGGSKPIPRIDFPTKDRWILARSKENEWDYEAAAKRITRLAEWDTRASVWGSGMIEKTAKGLPGAISTGPQAIAARINIHLFTQNNYEANDLTSINTEDTWSDPI